MCHQFAIPVIDLACLVTPPGRASVVGVVKAAAETVGFFQVVNHGVPEAAMSGMLAALRRFNEEPAEAKRPLLPCVPGAAGRGTGHSDPSFLTVLLQDAVGSLQVLVDHHNKQPAWVDVPAVAGALVVNVGDYLQLMSNDRLKSVEHRVLAKSVGPRVSVACFFRADESTRVLAPIVADARGARYRSTTVAELVRHYRAKGLDGVPALQHVRI